MLEAQEEIKEFCKERKWDNFDVKDLLLNMNDEIGEIWNLIKWVDENKQIKLFKEHKEEIKDFIGDMLFIVLKIANHAGVDSKEAIKKTGKVENIRSIAGIMSKMSDIVLEYYNKIEEKAKKESAVTENGTKN